MIVTVGGMITDREILRNLEKTSQPRTDPWLRRIVWF
jgi:hypothetical protein